MKRDEKIQDFIFHFGYQISLFIVFDGGRPSAKHKARILLSVFLIHGLVSWFLLDIISYAKHTSNN